MHLRSTMTAVAFGLAAAASLPAAAQDRDSHFDGPYVEGFIGTAANGNYNGRALVFDNNGDGRYDNAVTTSTGANAFSPGFCNGRANSARAADGCRSDKDGLEYGGRIGYDRRMNNFVLGALVEGAKNESIDAASGFSTTPASYTVERRLDYSVAARLRAGYTPGGGALFYVTGGAALAKINHRFLTTNTANSFDEDRDGKTRFGWQAGGGGEIMVTNNISLGVEYLYNRFKDNKYNVVVGRGTAPATNPFLLGSAGSTRIKVTDANFDYHSLRATVGFHF